MGTGGPAPEGAAAHRRAWGLWHRLQGVWRPAHGPLRLHVRYLGGAGFARPAPARLDVWRAQGAAVLWCGRQHLAFALGAVARVTLHGPNGSDGQASTVAIVLQCGRMARTLWLVAPGGGGESIYLELLLLLRPGAAAPPRER